MAIANPVYANAAFTGALAAAGNAISFNNSSTSPGPTAGEDPTLLTAAQNFAIAVDSAITTALGTAYDATVSASAGVTLAGSAATAAQLNALSSKPALLSGICQKALANTYATSGAQIPSAAQYAQTALSVATTFKASVTAAGWTTT